MLRVDRLDEFFAVCEDRNGKLITLERANLPENLREGDCLVRTETGWLVDEKATAERRKMLSRRFGRLFTRKKQD